MKINDIIIKPILTEKATTKAQSKIYTFEVGKKTNKDTIKEALQSVFDVKISKIRILVRKGKIKKVGRRMVNKKLPDTKIALVHVSEGTINVFPQV